jgi:hypothetical protein
MVLNYNSQQARDERGRFASGGGFANSFSPDHVHRMSVGTFAGDGQSKLGRLANIESEHADKASALARNGGEQELWAAAMAHQKAAYAHYEAGKTAKTRRVAAQHYHAYFDHLRQSDEHEKTVEPFHAQATEMHLPSMEKFVS